MPVNLERARDLFLHAVGKLPPEQWDDYVAEACGPDTELRRQVGHLLQVHLEAGSFLERPAEPVGTGAYTPADAEKLAPEDKIKNCEAAGTVIGPYKLLQQIGEGGMGSVFLAEQTAPVQRKVALKLIKSGMDSRQVISRFEAERQALALMDHPNIAKVLDAGTTATGRPYFVMELVKGVPITKYCDEHHLTPRQRLELFMPVCQAVQHAHQKGIIHRDLKPSNVMVCLYDGKPVPKVIDFGVAKAAGARLTEKTLFTELGQVVGTLEYMSPEQAELNQLDIDTRSDIYSLGVLLYELLTGTTPLERKRFQAVAFLEVLRLIREEESPKPSTRLSTTEGLPSIAANRGLEPKKLSGLVRGELDWIVMKTLEKDRNRRYETANGLALDVQRYLADEAVQACPPSMGYKLRKFGRRNRGPVFAGTLVLLALLLGTAVAAWQAVEARTAATNEANQRHVAEEEKKAADIARNTAEEERDRANWMVYAGKLALAQREFQDNNGIFAYALLDGCPRELRHWEHRHLLSRFKSKQTFDGHTRSVSSVCFSADGNRLASASYDETVRIWGADTGHELRNLKGHTGPVYSVAFSPDGNRLASASADQTVKIWDANTGQETALKGHTGSVFGVCFSPDGKRLASTGQDGTVRIWDAVKAREVRTVKAHNGFVYSVCFNPDGKRIASASGGASGFGEPGVVKVWDAETGQEIRTLKGHTDTVSYVCFSPDGKRIASASWDRTVKVWDADTGQQVLALKGHRERITSVCFSPDSKRLASASLDCTVKVWDAENGDEVFALKGQMDHFLSVCFSPDGKRLASALDRMVKVWDAAKGQEVLTLKGHTKWVFGVGFSPDGKRLASASADLTVKVWDAEKGHEVLALKGHSGQVSSVCFSPDGKHLASASWDRTVKVWDAEKGHALRALDGHTDRVYSVCFNPDGRRLASAGEDRTVKVWDVAQGREIFTLKGHTDRVHKVCFSPDGKRLASAGEDRMVKVWDAEKGQEVLALKGDSGGVKSVCFSFDGKRLASANEDGTVKIWNATNGREILALKGHLGAVSCVCFSPDGKRIVSGSADHTVKVWETEKGQEVLTLKGPTGDVTSVCFSPSGQQLAAASGYLRDPAWPGEVMVWDAE